MRRAGALKRDRAIFSLAWHMASKARKKTGVGEEEGASGGGGGVGGREGEREREGKR